MFKKNLITGALVATLGVSGMAFADDQPAAAAPAAPNPNTFTGNIGLYSQYVFRGLTQTNEKPAVQGGFDYAYNFGAASVYLGTWASNINWLADSLQEDSSMEWDFYGGVRGNFGKSDFTYDIGYLYYYYPGTVLNAANTGGFANGESGDTQEIYAQLGYKWVTAKYSYGVGNSYFAVRDASGTWYLNLTATVPLWDSGFTATAHWGDQKYTGTDNRLALGFDNDGLYSYTDWLVGVSYDASKLTSVLSGVTVGVNYTDTNAKDMGYTNFFGRNIGESQWIVYLSKSM